MALPSSIIQRGTRAAQPAATAVAAGTLYCVTDESDLVERSNGTTWDAFGATGGGGGGLVTTVVVKAADETVTSSVTLQDDDELALAVAASAVYLFELYLLLEAASNTPDVQYGFTLPAGASLSQTAWGLDVAQTVAPGAAAANNVGQAASASQQATPTAARGYGILNGNFAGLLAKGVVRTSTTPGTLTLQWAQRVSDPAGTVVKADSYLSLTRVS